MTTQIAVVGGGVIGLSVAWRLATAGHAVSLFDPAAGTGASWVAGGMLAPITEAWPGEEDVLRLGERSLRQWPEFADELAAEGHPPGLSSAGTVVVAADSADVAELDMLAEYLHRVGRTVETADRRSLSRLVPGLATSLRSGLVVPGDLAVDNRRLLTALQAAGARHGVETRAETVVEVGPQGVVTDGGRQHADIVVLAAGARSAVLHPDLRSAIRPLKGEIIRVRPGKTSLPAPQVTVRARVQGRPLYLVPRHDGELVVGATQYEAGFDDGVRAGGVRQLLDDAEQVFPSIDEYELTETTAGLRAASTDNLPLIGWLSDGVLVASGHYRNGLLLAPMTADAVRTLIDGGTLPDEVVRTDPGRVGRRESV